jgi:hypothetical protein
MLMALFEVITGFLAVEIIFVNQLINAFICFTLLIVILNHFLAFRKRVGKQALLNRHS